MIKSVVLLLLLFACNGKNSKSFFLTKQWHNKEIIIPEWNLKAKFLGRDTLCRDYFQKKYKIVMYVDSTECAECRLQLYQWYKYIQEYKNLDYKLSFFIIVHAENPKIIDILSRQYDFKYPIFHDKGGVMNKLNSFSNNIDLPTFLLNEENKVLVIGNPIKNKSIKKRIDDILKKGR